jgi:hypothetical protein
MLGHSRTSHIHVHHSHTSHIHRSHDRDHDHDHDHDDHDYAHHDSKLLNYLACIFSSSDIFIILKDFIAFNIKWDSVKAFASVVQHTFSSRLWADAQTIHRCGTKFNCYGYLTQGGFKNSEINITNIGSQI